METALEHTLTHCYKEEMIAFVATHPEAFDEGIKLALTDRHPYSWRAAWLLWSCMVENDPRIKRHIKDIIKVIKLKKDGHQRELIKILLMMELPEKYEGPLFDLCTTLWEDISKVPSVRWIALKMIVKITKKHPELEDEISFLIQDHFMETLSPGIRNSINRMFTEFNKKKINSR